jgi:hypothetical protein
MLPVWLPRFEHTAGSTSNSVREGLHAKAREYLREYRMEGALVLEDTVQLRAGYNLAALVRDLGLTNTREAQPVSLSTPSELLGVIGSSHDGHRIVSPHHPHQQDVVVGLSTAAVYYPSLPCYDQAAMENISHVSPRPFTNQRWESTIHLFWDDSVQVLRSQGRAMTFVRLPPYALLGVQSCLNHFEHVCLWSYSTIINAPKHVIECDATQLLPWASAEFFLCKDNASIAHIADAVRTFAVAEWGGWLCDVDNVWLKPPLPLHEQYYFSTSFSKKSKNGDEPFVPKDEHWAKYSWVAAAKHFKEWDGQDIIGTPLCLPPLAADTSRFTERLVSVVHEVLQGRRRLTHGGSNAYMWFMHAIRGLVVECNLQCCCVPPILHCPVPWWTDGRAYVLNEFYAEDDPMPQVKHGVALPTARDIFQKSVSVSHFFASVSKEKTAANISYDIFQEQQGASRNCLMAQLIQHVKEQTIKQPFTSDETERYAKLFTLREEFMNKRKDVKKKQPAAAGSRVRSVATGCHNLSHLGLVWYLISKMSQLVQRHWPVTCRFVDIGAGDGWVCSAFASEFKAIEVPPQPPHSQEGTSLPSLPSLPSPPSLPSLPSPPLPSSHGSLITGVWD